MDSTVPTAQSSRPAQEVGGLWSLWDMAINFQVGGVTHLHRMLVQEERMAEGGIQHHETEKARFSVWHNQGPAPPPFAPIPKLSLERTIKLLEYATSTVCKQLELHATLDRIERFQRNLKTGMNLNAFLGELRVLRETLEDGIRYKYFYHYPDEKVRRLLKFEVDWGAIIAQDKFPSSRADAFAATDCYALGLPTACVFHAMRVLEHGLRALAKDVGETFDVQQWHNIIEQIESRAAQEAKTLPRGMPKTERLQFLSEAAKEFRYFKDGWRNYVSHDRVTYDDLEAQGALDHVRAFMAALSERLSE
jgi:hypothetical protein